MHTQQAQQAPTPCTTYALFYDGKWISNEQQNEKKFLKLIEEVR
ncbi:YoaP domain-containing protein [Finegoldia magna]|nr:YoaP domain-containing protein [Finegoldia magna]